VHYNLENALFSAPGDNVICLVAYISSAGCLLFQISVLFHYIRFILGIKVFVSESFGVVAALTKAKK
jgi:hypothetical protein